jgi:hypothetical protein
VDSRVSGSALGDNYVFSPDPPSDEAWLVFNSDAYVTAWGFKVRPQGNVATENEAWFSIIIIVIIVVPPLPQIYVTAEFEAAKGNPEWNRISISEHPDGVAMLRRFIESNDDVCKRFSSFTMVSIRKKERG